MVDEHDFFLGPYVDDDNPVEIRIDAVLIDLTDEERRRFGDQHLRLWDSKTDAFIDEGGNGAVDRYLALGAGH